MNSTTSFNYNINTANKAVHHLINGMPNSVTTPSSNSLSQKIQHESVPLSLHNGDSATEHNNINRVRYNRTVHYNDAQDYLENSDCNRTALHENNSHNTKRHITHNIIHTLEKNNWITFFEKSGFGYFTTMFSPMIKNSFKGFDWKPTPRNIASSYLNLYCPSASMLLKLGLGLFTIRMTGASSTRPPVDNKAASTTTKLITDIETLNKIGHDPEFPNDGSYQLAADLDANQFQTSIPLFKGTLDGRGHTISNLEIPLITLTSGSGHVTNIIINNAYIFARTGTIGTIASIADDDSIISHITVLDSHIVNTEIEINYIGMIVGWLISNAHVENSRVENCTIFANTTHSSAGGLVGIMNNYAFNNTISDVNITAHKWTSCLIACMTGNEVSQSCSLNNKVSNCHIITNGAGGHAGFFAGQIAGNARIEKNTATDSSIQSNGPKTHIGLATGDMSVSSSHEIFNSTLKNSRVTATGTGSTAGIWISHPVNNIQICNNEATNCTAETTALNQETRVEILTRETTMLCESDMTVVLTTETLTIDPSIVDDISWIPVALMLGGGAVIVSIGVSACVGCSLYNAHKDGKRGKALVMHPFQSFGKMLANGYQYCRGNQSIRTEDTDTDIEEDEMQTEDMEMRLL